MRGQPTRLTDFSGGINLRDDVIDLSPEQSPDLSNVRPLGRGGGIVQREGDGDVASSSLLGFNPLGPMFYANGVMLLGASFGGVLAWTVATGGTAGVSVVQATAGSFVASMLTAIHAPASGGQGPWYFIHEPSTGRAARQWTGSGAAAAWTASTGTLPNQAKHLLYAGNRVWAANNGASTSSLYWSALGDPRNWPAANVVQLEPGDGEEITGMGTVGEVIVVFKETKAFVVYDLDTGANRSLQFGVGNRLARPRETPLGLVFVDPQRGLSVTDGFRVEQIDDILAGAGLEVTDVAFIDNSLFGIQAASGASDALWEYDTRERTWWRHAPLDIVNIVHYPDEFGAIRLAGVGRGANIDSLLNGGFVNAADAALGPYWTTPYLNWGSEQKKRLRALEMRGKGTVTFTGVKDYAGTSLFSRGPATVVDGGRVEYPSLGTARSVQVKITGSGTAGADQLRVDEFVMYVQQRSD